MSIRVHHSVDHGIERIEYIPETRRFQTPLLFQHGMYHSAHCWKLWQQFLAERGWYSVAYSLPGHGKSPLQRPIRWCTLGYYHQFLQHEIQRLEHPPVVFGHSMGGALLQWHFKHHTTPHSIVAAIFVAPWTSHTMLPSGLRAIRLDPLAGFLNFITLTATPSVRTPDQVRKAFLTANAAITAEELHAQVGPESLLVLLQYQPPFWKPSSVQPQIPLLWIAGEHDALIAEAEERRSAQFYGADYWVLPQTGHNIMMEAQYEQTIQRVHGWLQQRNIT